MKTGPDALGTAENESGVAKDENGTRRLRYLRKRVRKQNMKTGRPKTSLCAQEMKTGHDALGTPENESGSIKHENGT
jgi:hypothetical protein